MASDGSVEHGVDVGQNKRKNTGKATPKSAEKGTRKMTSTSVPLGRDGKPPLKDVQLEPYRPLQKKAAVPEKQPTPITRKRKNNDDKELNEPTVRPTKKTDPPSAKKQKTISTSQPQKKVRKSLLGAEFGPPAGVRRSARSNSGTPAPAVPPAPLKRMLGQRKRLQAQREGTVETATAKEQSEGLIEEEEIVVKQAKKTKKAPAKKGKGESPAKRRR